MVTYNIPLITNGTWSTSLPSPPVDKQQTKSHNHFDTFLKKFCFNPPRDTAHCCCVPPPQPPIWLQYHSNSAVPPPTQSLFFKLY